jgi:hypothetical protein
MLRLDLEIFFLGTAMACHPFQTLWFRSGLLRKPPACSQNARQQQAP